METTSSSTFDTSAIAIESNTLSSPRSPRCNEQPRSLNFKLSPALNSPEVRRTSDGKLYDSEKLKSELLLKADEFFNTGCIKIEQLKSELTIEQVLLRQNAEIAADGACSHEQVANDVDMDVDDNDGKGNGNCDTRKCPEKGVSINIDDEFEVLLEHIEGLNTPEIANDMLGLKLCSNFDISSKAIVVSSLETLAKILNMPEFDPHAPPVKFKIKRALSLHELGHREDNVITIDIPMESIDKYMESKDFNPFNRCLNIYVKHDKEEFCTFCSCTECMSYREVVVHMMMEQFKLSHMVVLLLDALLKAYRPLLKNASAFSHFEKLLEVNKDIHWVASGLIYNKKYEELDFIYDESLTDPTILVLFTSILMINSPMQLLQILSFYISCVVEAFAFGIAEVSVEEKLIYILDGFDHLCDISDQIASYFVIFERNFLSKFSLTWLWLCQRIFHQQVYVRFFVAITNCGEVLKKDDPLKLRYSEFVKRMLYLDMCWAKFIWPKLQRYNLTDAEINRRSTMVVVHRLFDSLIEDALRLPIHDSNDDRFFENMHTLKDRRVLWMNILSFAKMQWPDGFFDEPNVYVYDSRCEQCGSVSMEHSRGCKCITCAIGGIPLFQNGENLCRECATQDNSSNNSNNNDANSKEEETESGVESENEAMETETTAPGAAAETAAEAETEAEAEHNGVEKCQRKLLKMITNNVSNVVQDDFLEIKPVDVYHISWAVFKHFTQRKLYVRDKIDEKYICKDCRFPACMLARRLLNNEMSPALTKILMSHFHPLPMLQSDLHGIFPVVFYFNPRMFASHHESSLHNTVVKAYWTFIVSVFGTFFVDVEKPCPLNLDALEIEQSDVRVSADKLKGNPDDSIFLEFLDTIRSSSAAGDGAGVGTTQGIDQEFERGRKKLDEFLKPTKKGFNQKNLLRISTESIKMPSTAIDTGDVNTVTVQPTSSNSMPGMGCFEGMDQKRSCTPKSKKCCLEHAADFGADHCKENHANRKRLKKDCSHARAMQTRDRLRKKLQDVRKNQQQQQQIFNARQTQHQKQQLLQQQQQLQQQLQQQQNQQQQQQQPQPVKLPQKIPIESCENVACDEPPLKNVAVTRKLSPTTTPVTGTNTPQSIENVDDSDQVIGKVMEICDMLDNNKQKMKKWLDETLTYIEGYASSATPTSTTNAKKTQPQTKDPKKAAKKAKQKLRKEEEKRIGELHEVRDQFQDVYFKEFLEKIELKTLKNGGVASATSSGTNGGGTKKRYDKKRIADVEANIKKLQRAKAKLESNILELIATVKQTNTDFKFPYLPTKEQQQAKLQELAEDTKASACNEESASNSPPSAATLKIATPHDEAMATAPPHPPPGVAAGYMPPFPKFYPNISFPYEMSFPGCTAAPPPPPYGHTALPTGCYAPPKQQALSPNVMAALAANEESVSNSATDPSKRIVTIRRVHNPNMPDSQVTVTARGGQHGKEKLLYTFVNGTMMPTTAGVAGNEPQSAQQQQQNHVIVGGGAGQQLTKSQLKKERRRLAKLLSLAQDLAISDCEDDEGTMAPPPPQTKQQNVKNTKTVKDSKHDKQEKKLTKGSSLDSTSSGQSVKQAPPQKSAKSSSKAPVSTIEAAQNAKKSKNKKEQSKQQKETLIKTSGKQVAKKQDEEEHSDDSDVSSTPPPTVVQRSAKQKKSHTQKKPMTQMIEKLQKSQKIKADEPLPADTVKQQNQRRLKLVNHGQFDNNPYKNLHMQDSDSELDVTASSCDEEDEEEEEVEEEDEEATPVEMKVAEAATPDQLQPKSEKTKQPKQKSKSTAVKNTTTTVSSSSRAEKHNRSRATQTPSASKTEDSNTASQSKALKQQQQQPQQQKQQIKKENGSSNRQRQSEPPKVKQTTTTCAQTQTTASAQTQTTNYNNERRRTDSSASTSAVQQRRGNKKQESNLHAASNRNAPPAASKSNYRENERSKSAKDQSYNAGQGTMTSTGTVSKRGQRARKKQQQQQPMQQHQMSQHHLHHNNYSNYTDCGAGIPLRMEYFNPNEVNIPPPQPQQQAPYHRPQQQQMQYETLSRQFQGMRVAPTPTAQPSYASISATTAPNVSIMDQLNRGVQVENLFLPPGITLTKVDPIKSEQLRLKSESIKRLSQPLQQQTNMPTGYAHHHHHGSTIIAPPTTSHYMSSAPGGNIIMVEGITPKLPTQPSTAAIAAAAAAATATGKASSKSRRRRNKGKRNDCSPRDSVSTNASSNNDQQQQQSKMVTLRNPMFHAGPAAAAASILQQPTLLAGHQGYAGNSGGLPMAAPVPDQPAAIIKNENGMFTIRNPALHQAVTNGLALGGYRQFGGNVSYYTPQEAVAEAAKAQQQQQQQQQQTQQNSQRHANVALPTESFSYFSNNSTTTNKMLPTELLAQPATKKISITCTTIDPQQSSVNSESDSLIQRNENPSTSPVATQRCISAIGSEIKQNRHSANAEHMWSEYRQPPHDLTQSNENLSNISASLLGNSVLDAGNNSNQQSDYFNGYEVFPTQRAVGGSGGTHMTHAVHSTPAPSSATTSSLVCPPTSTLPRSPNPLFETNISDSCHMGSAHQHHRCGDDSPPPTSLLGYSSTYLDDIPNTGVIRYDDASFLKNLIPGQRLNKEVSIHNINESNFGRPTSPMSHLIEITPVFNVGSNSNKVVSPAPSIERQQHPQHYLRNSSSSSVSASAAGTYSANSMSNYQQNFNDYDPSSVFPSTGSNDNTTASSTGSAEQAYQPFGYDAFDTSRQSDPKSTINSLFPTNFTSTGSQRSSPYLDESFVQNLNALQISGGDGGLEQCAQQQLNGETLLGNATNNCNATTSSTSASGWW